jgi:cysteine desulfurase family protein (TIGR01976 family)
MALDNAAVTLLRTEFPALLREVEEPRIIFFDSPGGSQVHMSVSEAMVRYFTEANSNAHGAFLFSRRTDELTYEARRALADFINADRPEEIVFGPNMTTLTFRISEAIGKTLRPNDEIVVTRLDHDANVAPWMALQARGVIVHVVDFDPADCTLDMNGMRDSINERTKLVAVGYASNAVGTINDVRAVVNMAHEVGAWVYVDAVHYAPHAPIDVTELGCDFLACSAYKFFGPHLGVLYGRYDLLETIPARKVVPAGDAPPDKFETGTNNFEGISGTAAAIGYLSSIGERFGDEYLADFHDFSGRRLTLKTGMVAIRSYEMELCRRLLMGLKEIPGVRIYGIAEPDRMEQRVPTVSFTLEGLTPNEVARKLGKKNIFVWDGHFYAVRAVERLGLANSGGLVRIGLCHYNTLEEVEILLDSLSTMNSL